MSIKIKTTAKSCYKLIVYLYVLPYRQYYLFCNFCIAVCLSMLGISLKPLASNQGALAQSNPSPKVLSGEVMYQWHDASGTSTEHFDQSSAHCGTCTHSKEDSKKVSKLIMILIIQHKIVLYVYYLYNIRIISRLVISLKQDN